MHCKLRIKQTPVLFANISVTTARIFMKFYVVVNDYLVNLSSEFHEDLCEVLNARAHVLSRVHTFTTCAFVHRSS